MTEREEDFCRAIYDDLGRSRFESKLYEINLIQSEIQHALDHVGEWMKPRSKSTDLLNMPGSSCVRHDPLGVVLIMAPWNYPIQLVFAPLVGALAAGNTVLIRPANYTPHVASAVAQMIAQYFDPNVVAVVTGEREVTTAVLQERFDMVFFTGGPTLGKVVYSAAAKHLTPVILELGGKSPAIVDRSCDIDITAKRLVWAAFANAGQTCVRPDFVMVHEAVGDKLVARMKELIQQFYRRGDDQAEFASQPGARPAAEDDEIRASPYVARVVDGGGAFERLSGILEHDRAFVAFGGAADAGSRYIQPTVLDFGADMAAFAGSKAMEAEIFGPILPVVRVPDVDAAITYVRGHEKPLALYCFASDSAVQERVAARTSSGSLVFNDCMMQLVNASLPFGGVGRSGMGMYHGEYSFRAFTHEKSVLRKFAVLDLPARYPPYTSGKRQVMVAVARPIPSSTATAVKASALVVAIAGAAYLAKDLVLPRVLPGVIRFLENINAKL